ncbi:hypothetical protein D3C73_846200 [compost metagenome]
MLACLNHFHQFAEGIEAARETAVGVELHQDFLGLADAQACIQPFVQRGVQRRHVAGGHGCRDQRDALLFGRQGLRNRWGGDGCLRAASVVLLIGDLLHPLGGLAVHRAGDRQVGHAARRRSAVPMLDAGWADDHVSGANLLHRFAPFLDQPYAGRHHQPLPGRVGVPGRPRTRFEIDVGAGGIDCITGGEQRLDAHPPGEPLLRPRDRRLGAGTGDLLFGPAWVVGVVRAGSVGKRGGGADCETDQGVFHEGCPFDSNDLRKTTLLGLIDKWC